MSEKSVHNHLQLLGVVRLIRLLEQLSPDARMEQADAERCVLRVIHVVPKQAGWSELWRTLVLSLFGVKTQKTSLLIALLDKTVVVWMQQESVHAYICMHTGLIGCVQIFISSVLLYTTFKKIPRIS